MMTTVSTHTNGIEAHIVRCRLEYEGIPASVAFEHHIWAMWTRSLALGGVRVKVPNVYFESAQIIVSNIMTGVYESELDIEELKPELSTCPGCYSEDIKTVNWPWKTALLMLFIFNVPLPYTKYLQKCGACSHLWIAHEQRGFPLHVILIIFLISTASFIAVGEMWCHWCRLHCENTYICLT